MATATLTSKGQLVIPKPIRDHLHLHRGDTLDFLLQELGRRAHASRHRRRAEPQRCSAQAGEEAGLTGCHAAGDSTAGRIAGDDRSGYECFGPLPHP